MNWIKTLIISLSILALAAIATYVIFSTEPEALKEGATKKTAMLVNTIPAVKGTYQPVIQLTGSVQPEQEIILSPRVSGEIIKLASAFVPGGTVSKGQPLVYLDPADFRNMVKMRESELAQAKADLEIEKGRQEAARMEYELAGQDLSEEKKSLVLRRPQMLAIESRIDAASVALEQAKLQLDRTIVKAPFNAQIISRNANVGSQVSPGMEMAGLTGLDNYWVILTLPAAKLKWLSFPDRAGQDGSEVTIRNRTAWPDSVSRKGYLFKSLGILDNQTRLARVIAEISDPLAKHSGNKNAPPLLIGSFVQASIKADSLQNIIRLPRKYLRKNNTAWVMKNEKLQIRSLDIIMTDDQFAYINSGLDQGDSIITTNLSTVVEGSPLRTETNSNKKQGDHSVSMQENN